MGVKRASVAALTLIDRVLGKNHPEFVRLGPKTLCIYFYRKQGTGLIVTKITLSWDAN